MSACACDTCARYLGRMRGSSLYRCMDRYVLGAYVPVSPPRLSDGQEPADACAGWTRYAPGEFGDGVR